MNDKPSIVDPWYVPIFFGLLIPKLTHRMQAKANIIEDQTLAYRSLR